MKKSIRIFTSVFLFISILFFNLPLFGGVINVPGDYPTIQAGIDAATLGDTVLVQPNTYFESISFKGKNIVVGSLFLTTSDPSYITQTVIEGMVNFVNNEDSTAVLRGFTVTTDDYGIYPWGGIIMCTGSGPKLENLIIRGNPAGQSGGLSCKNATTQLINSTPQT